MRATLRLHLLVAIAVTNCGLPPALAHLVMAQALRQYHARWPLAEYVVTAGHGFPAILSVGRN